MSGNAVARPPRPCPLKADLIEELIASMEEGVRIIAGKVPPSRVHTAVGITARAAAQEGEAMSDQPGTVVPGRLF